MTLFYKNIFTVLTGTGIAQLIPVLGSLLIVRIFSPSVFGEYAFWLSFTIILSVIISGRFETCIAIKNPGVERNKAVYFTLITIGLGAILFIALLIPIYVLLYEFIKINEPSVIFLTPVSAFFTALIQLIISYYGAQGFFKKLTILRIVQSSLILILQVFSGLIFENCIFSLVISHLSALIITVVMIFYTIKTDIKFKNLKPQEVKTFWKDNKKYLQYSLPADTISSVSAELPILLVVSKYGSEAGGILALTFRVLGAPIGLIAKAVLDVFKKYASDEFREKGNCLDIFNKTLFVLVVFSFLFYLFSYIFIEDVFLLAFGNDWVAAGEFAKILLLLFTMRFIASPLSYVVYISERQEVDLYWQVMLLMMTVTAFYFSSNIVSSLNYYNNGYTLLYLLYLILCFGMAKNNERYKK